MEQPVYHRIQRPRRHFPWLFFSILLVAVLLVVSLVIYRVDQSRLDSPATEPVQPSSLKEGDTVTIAAAGDITLSDEILRGVRDAGYNYDFTQLLLGVAPLLSDADITVADLEANFCEGIYNGTNYIAPPSLLTALAGAGVDLVQTANTASIYNGMSGLISTVNAVKNAGLIPVGTFTSQEEYRKSGGYTMVEVNGFRIAFVAFTKGVGNLNLPEGSDNCVNLLYRDYATTYQDVDRAGIQAVLDSAAAAGPDITVAMLHWGSELDDEISETQEEIRDLMLDHGVDVILGTHSHLVGPVDVTTREGTVVAYSLGNLISTEYGSMNQGLVLKLGFRYTGGRVVLETTEYQPIYLASGKETASGRMELLNTNSIISLYESDYITRVSEDIYETLCSSRDRIAELTVMKKD